VVFSTDYAVEHNSDSNSASVPGRTGSNGSDVLPPRNDSLTAPPRRVSRSRGSIAPVSFTPEDDPLSMAPMLEGESRRKSSNYLTHEGCMEGEWVVYQEKGLGYERVPSPFWRHTSGFSTVPVVHRWFMCCPCSS
jgi:hypothetical protein